MNKLSIIEPGKLLVPSILCNQGLECRFLINNYNMTDGDVRWCVLFDVALKGDYHEEDGPESPIYRCDKCKKAQQLAKSKTSEICKCKYYIGDDDHAMGGFHGE